MKQFTKADIHRSRSTGFNGNDYLRIYVDREQLIDCPLDWQKQGLQQTATGYGRKLTSRYKIHFEGKARRLYTTCFSNVGSTWFRFNGETIFVD